MCGPWAFMTLCLQCSDQNGVIINEIQYHPQSADKQDEWLELYNASSDSKLLKGLQLSGGLAFRFCADKVLPPRHYCIVARDPARFSLLYPHYSGLLFGPYEGSLNNAGERLELRSHSDEVLHKVEYDDEEPWPVAADGYGKTLELRSPLYDSSQPGSWEASRVSGGTPGSLNSTFEDPVGNAPPWFQNAFVKGISGQHGYLPTSAINLVAHIQYQNLITSVTVFFQVLNPGEYSHDAAASKWETIRMLEEGCLFTSCLGQFPNRALVRWRIVAKDSYGRESSYPRESNPMPYSTFFVYDGPQAPPEEPDCVERLPIYFLIVRSEQIRAAQSGNLQGGRGYPWTGAFVYKGKVYDRIQYRVRGGRTLHERGKRSLKLRFNRYDLLSSNLGYLRRHVNLNRTMEYCGIHEASAAQLYKEAGVLVPEYQFARLQIIHDQSEGADMYGLYLDCEEISRRFLKGRGIKAEYLYKMQGTPELRAGTESPTQGINELIEFKKRPCSEWVMENINLKSYLSFRSIAEITGTYDLGNRNYFVLKQKGAWEVIPSDLNGTFGLKYTTTRDIFSEEVLALCKEQYDARLKEIRQLFNAAKVSKIATGFSSRISAVPDAQTSMWGLDQHPDAAAAALENFARRQHEK